MIKIDGATIFEQSVMEHIITKEAPEFEKHLKYISVDRREDTGVGSFLYLKYTKEPPLIAVKKKTLGISTYAEIDGLDGGAGFLLYIDNGMITMLELFSHSSDSWPKNISRFKILDI